MEKRLLGIEELSEYIGIRPQTIRNRLSCGTFPIPAKKVCGRVKFDRKDIDSYLDKLKAYNITKSELTPVNNLRIIPQRKGGSVSKFAILPVPSIQEGGQDGNL